MLDSEQAPSHVCAVRVLLFLFVLTLSCTSVPTSTDAKISYATVPSTWPATTECLNKTGVAVAKEVLNGKLRTVVIAAGPNPISDDAWKTYTPSLGNQKNSDRFLLFSKSCFARSPSKLSDCVGEACSDVITMDGFTWVGLSKIEAADCVPSVSACDGTTAKPGGLLVVVTRKCHELIFEGEVTFLNGPRGERAVMHATADGNPTTDVTLPPGWALEKQTLTSPLVVHPFGGGDACFYNVIRDHKLQSYHQLAYASPQYP